MAMAFGDEEDMRPVLAAARAGEYDRYIAALLAPATARADLLALAAFAAEIGRVPAQVRETMAGEIRLQWWRDALAQPLDGERTGSPVADALRRTAMRRDLPVPLLIGLIDGIGDRLSRGPAPGGDMLRAHVFKTEGTLFDLAARIVAGRGAPSLTAAVAAAAEAYGIARALHGRLWPLSMAEAEDWAKRAREALQQCDSRLRETSHRAHAAFAPVAVVPLYLDAATGVHPQPADHVLALPPLRRLWRLFRAARGGRLI